MSQDLLNSALHLVNSCSLLHKVSPQDQSQSQNKKTPTPSIKPIHNYDVTDIANEQKQVRIFHLVQKAINKIIVNSTDDTLRFRQSRNHNIDTFEQLQKVLSIYTTEPSLTPDKELIKYITKLLTQIKPKVEEISLMTSAITRSVHGVEGISSKEQSIKDLMKERDRLVLEVLLKEKEVAKLDSGIEKFNRENSLLLEEIKSLVKAQKKGEEEEDEEEGFKSQARKSKQLKTELTGIQEKNIDIGDQIQETMVRSGVNWAQNEDLREIFLRCGEIITDH